MVDLINPLDTFFVNLFLPFNTHPSIELFVSIIVNLIYFYGFAELYFLIKSKEKIRLTQFISAVMIGLLLVFALKYYIDRPRPYVTFNLNIVESKSDPSFPSAHTFLAFVLYYFVSKIPRVRKYHLLVGLHLLILVPVGLMVTGVHYFTDVLIGGIIGYIMPLIISEKVIHKVISKFS